MKQLPTFAQFQSGALARGFDEVLERVWKPGTVLETHTHPFEADALVVQGEMWLGENGVERRLLPGDTFHLAPDTPHTERYGASGATYWVARKS
ncbi:cupin domain-containing protein [Caenimonas aquaedulcis]|uniref:Cupin domain-containing protein n=1 Tax=Caenimonas aquaedulcis TaxID=2793270 RepID=A0A931H4Q4_9BURK|nr:cupin domain-containing protein [Caenimonas aquaedulcis]MBG9388452.1 cupin domain-containing protein [Caenimonas aquaedulcis]